MLKHFPDAPFEDAMLAIGAGYELAAVTIQEDAARTQAILDSPAGQLMKANPEMTVADAMRTLRYWPRKGSAIR